MRTHHILMYIGHARVLKHRRTIPVDMLSGQRGAVLVWIELRLVGETHRALGQHSFGDLVGQLVFVQQGARDAQLHTVSIFLFD